MLPDPAIQKTGTATPYGDLQPVERMARRRPRVVIVGAGWGGLTLARRLRSVPVDVELIDRNNYRLFGPFVYQVAAGMLSPGDVAPSVRQLIRSVRSASFLKAEVTGVDAQNSRVLADRGIIGWLFWLTCHILILDTFRARFTALINWAAFFLFREPPLRLDVSADRHQAPD